jgi:arginyl-tRNA synthetase
MTTSWQFWTSDLVKRLSEALKIEISSSDVVIPPDRKLGDFAFGCFKLAKALGKSPADIAKEVASSISLEHSDFVSANAAGPYVNFILREGDAVHRVVREIEVAGEQFGLSDAGKKQEILLEYASLNSHKEIHVGHLRNLVLGASLQRILDHAGWKVVPMSYYGDIGTHVAKCLWLLVKTFGFDPATFGQKELDQLLSEAKPEQRTGKYLGEIYAKSSAEMELVADGKGEVSKVLQKLESVDPVWNKLWQDTRRWSFDEMTRLFDELGVKLVREYLESEVVDRGQEMVDHLIKKGIAKESQGAMIIDLEDKKLGVFLVRKSDGTSLYATKDLALAELKLKEYPKAKRSLILVDNRQSLYFKQLFATLEMMEIRPVPEFVGYEFVTLKSGAMSSRDGNVVTYQNFRDEVIKYATDEVSKRHASGGEHEWSDGKIEHTAWCIAMAGMKFGMLKQDSDKMFTFDLEQSLSFDGDTGPYCLYAATRLASIMRKAQSAERKDNPFGEAQLTRGYDHATEKSLAFILAQFPMRVHQAAEELRPSIIAQWCIDAAQSVSAFYHAVPVLESEGELKEGRLRLVAAARQALVAGLGLLSIPVPDEM